MKITRSSTRATDLELRNALAGREDPRFDVDVLAEAGLRDELGGDPQRVALRRRFHHHHRSGRSRTAVQRAVVAREVGRKHESGVISVGRRSERGPARGHWRAGTRRLRSSAG